MDKRTQVEIIRQARRAGKEAKPPVKSLYTDTTYFFKKDNGRRYPVGE